MIKSYFYDPSNASRDQKTNVFNQTYKRLINIFPFADINLTVSEDKVNQIANNATNKLNASLVELRRLFLVENMLDSVKFGLSLWVLTYIGSWFNAMTLILMSWVGLFTIPKVTKGAKTMQEQPKCAFEQLFFTSQCGKTTNLLSREKFQWKCRT